LAFYTWGSEATFIGHPGCNNITEPLSDGEKRKKIKLRGQAKTTRKRRKKKGKEMKEKEIKKKLPVASSYERANCAHDLFIPIHMLSYPRFPLYIQYDNVTDD
jgi:hypothetical protein